MALDKGKATDGKATDGPGATEAAGPAEARPDSARRRPRRGGHVVPWLVLGLAILAVVLTLVALGLSGRSIPVPHLIVAQIEGRANRALQGQASLAIGSGDLVVTDGFVPQMRLANVTVKSARGQELARIADLRASFDPDAILGARLQPLRLSVHGARVAIRRLPDGSLDIAPGAAGFSGAALRPADIIDALDAAFALPALAGLDEIRVDGLALLLDDRRSGQVWTVSDGRLSLRQDAESLRASVDFGLAGQVVLSPAPDAAPRRPGAASAPATVAMTLVTDKASPAAELTARVRGVSAHDLGAQVPALAWLGAVDAPISGEVTAHIDYKGDFGLLEAGLDIGQGVLRPTRDTRPVSFDGARVGLAFDPARALFNLTELKIESPSLNAEATGQAWLKDFRDGMPRALVGQVDLRNLTADPHGVFARPVTIDQGALDVKVDLAPFRVTIGQLALVDRGHRIGAKGAIAAGPNGWQVGMDFAVDAIETQRLLALWPVAAVPKTREWLADNVATGELFDVKAALRLIPGEEPRFALGYQFRGAEVRFMKTFPPIIDGSGYSTIEDNAYVLVAEKGRIRAPEGGELDIAGSVVKVPNILERPTPAEIRLKSRSSITAALSILSQPPLNIMQKTGKPVDLAEGEATVEARIGFKLVKALKPGDVAYDVAARLSGVRSDRIVKDRVITADALALTATPKGVEISGQATLDSVPFRGRWTQAFGREAKGESRVEGVMDLTYGALQTFGVALPDGSVKGKGEAQVTVDLARDAPPALKLTSDLRGLTLAIPEVGWAKAAGRAGNLTLEASLGQPARIDRLDITAPGLDARGQVTLTPDGGLDKLVLPGLRLGDWFEGDATLTGRGKGRAVGVEITGGSADMRRADFGDGGAGGDRPPLKVRLDSLRISQDIALTGFRGTFTSGAALEGDFAGFVNGQAPVYGSVVPGAGGRSAFRIESEDAGQVFAAAGIYESGRKGRMKLILQPTGDKGNYNGTLSISNIRVVDAPALAGLLDAISVVGLLTQLQGPGILFTDVTGQFLLTPGAVEIRQGSAVGPSLGVSMAGVYNSTDRSVDLQGVISPIYLLNGIGQIFSRQRDGLFGFSYTLTGTRDATRVSVNPLSILTPGMFRDIFRKDPATISR